MCIRVQTVKVFLNYGGRCISYGFMEVRRIKYLNMCYWTTWLYCHIYVEVSEGIIENKYYVLHAVTN